MTVDVYATMTHYLAHIEPIWRALDMGERGTIYLAGQFASVEPPEWVQDRVEWGAPHGLGPAVIVAGIMDQTTVERAGRRTVYVEHGAGQSYDGDPNTAGDTSYSGSGGHDGTALFLCPSEAVADRWRDEYPETPAVAVGCPRLDRWHDGKLKPSGLGEVVPTVAVTFHGFGARKIPETIGAWRHYDDALPALADRFKVIGHGHPRLWRKIEQRWQAIGVETVPDVDDVFARASVLVGDNTSLLPEAASLGIPLVWLNAPWYRRDVQHGGRFWDWPRGQVGASDPEHLVRAVEIALSDPPEVRTAREEMVRTVYVATDGQAAQRAAEAIRAHVGP
jgi:hypothetical protein